MLQEIPRLFDDNGQMIADIDTSKMDPPMLERYSAVANSYMANQQAETVEADALAEVKAAAAAVHNVQDYIAATWRPMTYHDLWKASFTGEAYARSGRR